MRRNWGDDAEGLSEELFAMFSPDVPNNTQAPVKINLPAGSTVAPIQIGNLPLDGSVPTISLHGQDGSQLGSFTFSGGNITFTDSQGNQSNAGGGNKGGGVPVWG